MGDGGGEGSRWSRNIRRRVTMSETTTEELLFLDPTQMIVGANVRTDLPDAKEFERSVRDNGVVEAVVAYRDDEGRFVVLRGQRRTVTAAQVGTPSGTIPVRVVPQPDEVDRISHQMVENLHRAAMRSAEVVAGVEQLALLGVSPAQIRKRTSLPREEVAAALSVAKTSEVRAMFESGDLTLDQAALLVEFEGDEEAVAALTDSFRYGGTGQHVAQRLRDARAERAVRQVEVDKLRAEGIEAFVSRRDLPEGWAHPRTLRTAEGDEINEDQWPTLPTAACYLDEVWHDPMDDLSDEEREAAEQDEAFEYPEHVRVFVPRWVVLDPAEAGLTHYATHGRPDAPEVDAEAAAAAKTEERRRVIANNKAWDSAETVRREWLTQFVSRKTAPKGAEALIAEVMLLSPYWFAKHVGEGNANLFTLAGHTQAPSRYTGEAAAAGRKMLDRAGTAKAQVMVALAVVVAAWDESLARHSWRAPDAWNARMLEALIQWGYEASDVELLMRPAPPADEPATTEATPEVA